MSPPKLSPEPFERAVDRLFAVAQPQQLRLLRRQLAELEKQEPPPTAVTPAEADAALDWLLELAGYERAA